ncbi:MAG: ROK family transcriptional regulator [Anaerolinea sp.]|nr:ROK family transcriptional regulator [Anaerolinea sp.]
MKKATRQQTKTHNTRLILRTIYEQGAVSRADIARATNLTRPTVSSIVASLIADALVIETGQSPPTGGKPATLLTIAEDAYQIIAIDLSSESFCGALINLRGKISGRAAFARNGRSGDAALSLVYELIDALYNQAETAVLGIGVGTPGLVNPHQGIIKQAINLGWQDVHLRDLLAARYQTPIYVANDSHMAALAEYTFGAARDSRHLILIKMGQGISAGILINGQPLYGDGFGAGEIGHVVVMENGPRCRCGNRGCLEALIGSNAILAQASSHAGVATWPELAAAAGSGDPQAQQVITQAGRALGIATANLVGSFNIHHIIIAGAVSQCGDAFLQAVRQEMAQRVLPAMAAETTLRFSSLGDDNVLLGSAATVLKQELGVI